MNRVLIGITSLLVLAACDGSSGNGATSSAIGQESKTSIEADCRGSKLTEYHTLMDKQDYWRASLAIRKCGELMKDAQLTRMAADAEIKSHLRDIENPKTSSSERLRLIEMLQRDYPEETRQHESQIAKFKVEANAKAYAEEAKLKAAEAKRRRSEGVEIGMTREEVLASSWGKPQAVNKTTNASGTSEQWIYGGRNYLYFRDGILETIQN